MQRGHKSNASLAPQLKAFASSWSVVFTPKSLKPVRHVNSQVHNAAMFPFRHELPRAHLLQPNIAAIRHGLLGAHLLYPHILAFQ
eukprot:scaffold275786_cov15-Tisochrysis_lutea.AAC.1